eukprot:3561505-Pyramimonas_sp.AAC.1
MRAELTLAWTRRQYSPAAESILSVARELSKMAAGGLFVSGCNFGIHRHSNCCTSLLKESPLSR